jgi:protein-S-isoprenylcysteine O-methyltransferase Ste14
MMQVRLGASRRIGIEEGARPGFVTGGMYRWCCNPIYAWWMLWMIGYLLATYGDEYRTYASRVGHFVPGMGLRRTSPVK